MASRIAESFRHFARKGSNELVWGLLIKGTAPWRAVEWPGSKTDDSEPKAGGGPQNTAAARRRDGGGWSCWCFLPAALKSRPSERTTARWWPSTMRIGPRPCRPGLFWGGSTEYVKVWGGAACCDGWIRRWAAMRCKSRWFAVVGGQGVWLAGGAWTARLFFGSPVVTTDRRRPK
jgi:hypothetical protein